MALRPALVIGLGAFGSQALLTLTKQLRHGYVLSDLERVSFLQLGTASQGDDPLIRNYIIKEDMDDWFGSKPNYSFKDRASTPIALRDWFNLQNRVQARNAHPSDYNRQLNRAMFLHHLASGECLLPDVLNELLKRFKGDNQAQKLLPVFVLGTLDEAFFSATLIDLLQLLATLTRKIELGNLRTTIFAGFPSVSLKQNDDPSVYATLQEMQRFVLQGDIKDTPPLIDMVCLNDDAPDHNFAENSLYHSWAYVLMGLIDGGLGEYLNQHWFVNRPKKLSDSQHHTQTTKVISMRSSAVVVPRQQLLDGWIDRLTKESLIYAFSKKSEVEVNAQQLLTDWLGLTRKITVAVKSPHLLRWLVETIVADDVPDITQQIWEQLAGKNPATPHIHEHVTKQHFDAQTWNVSLNDAELFKKNINPTSDFHNRMKKKIEDWFGGKDGDGLGGSYKDDVAFIAQKQIEFCEKEFLALSRWVLEHHPQLAIPTLTSLKQKLTLAETKFTQALKRHNKASDLYDELESIRENLRVFYQPSMMGLVTKPSHYLMAYIRSFNHLLDQFRQRILLWQLQQLCSKLAQHLQEYISSIKEIEPYVWQGDSSLLGYAQRPSPPPLPTHGVYLLANSTWEQARYEEYKKDFQPRLASKLQWVVESSKAVNLSMVGRTLITEADFKERNYQAWRETVAEYFVPVWKDLTIWNYLRDVTNQADRQRVESASQIELSPLLQVDIPADLLLSQNYIALPSNDPSYDHLTQSVSLNLKNRNQNREMDIVADFKSISSDHAYIYLSTLDLAPLNLVKAYQQAMQAYEKLNVSSRLGVHTRVADVTVARLLDKAKQWEITATQVSRRMYYALEHLQKAKQFILLGSTIGSIQINKSPNHTDHFYWYIPSVGAQEPITQPSPTPDMGEAFVAFCQSEVVDKHSTALEKHRLAWLAQQKRLFTSEDQQLLGHWRIAYRLRDRGDADWAQIQALTIDHLEQFLRQISHSSELPEDLQIVLVLLCKEMIEDVKEALRKKGEGV